MHYMFNGATSFSQDISDWNTSAAVNMTEMFENTPVLSNANKDKIHSSFSTNPNWPYDWSAYAYADANATLSGTVNYSGPVTGPVVVWAFENGQKVAELTLPNGPGPYSLQLLKNRNYDAKAFRDGNGNGNLDAGWQVGEPFAHHGDWNSTSSSFNTLLLDGNKTGIDLKYFLAQRQRRGRVLRLGRIRRRFGRQRLYKHARPELRTRRLLSLRRQRLRYVGQWQPRHGSRSDAWRRIGMAAGQGI